MLLKKKKMSNYITDDLSIYSDDSYKENSYYFGEENTDEEVIFESKNKKLG